MLTLDKVNNIYSHRLVPHSELNEPFISLSLNTEVTSDFPHIQYHQTCQPLILERGVHRGVPNTAIP